MDYFLLVTKYEFCSVFISLRLSYLGEEKQVQSYSQSEVSGEQTNENVLGSARLRAVTSCLLPPQINAVLESISVLLSLK